MTRDAASGPHDLVAQALRRYFDGERYDAGAAFADVAPDLCLWLGVVIGEMLAKAASWSPWWAIDDACPQAIERHGDGSIEVSGIADVLGDSAIASNYPFSVMVRADPSTGRFTAETVRFGDADVGLRSSVSDRRRRRWPEVATWRYVVTSRGS